MTTTEITLSEPLYKLQARALTDAAAAEECARFYAAKAPAAYRDQYSPSYQLRLQAAYLAGLRGEPEPRRQSNYGRPLVHAWRAGRELRDLLLKDRA